MGPVVLGQAHARVAAVDDVLTVDFGQVGEEIVERAKGLVDVAVDHGPRV
jgi:hypothetical protein